MNTESIVLLAMVIVFPILIAAAFFSDLSKQTMENEQQQFNLCIAAKMNWVKGDCTK